MPGVEAGSISIAQNNGTQILYGASVLSGVEAACWWQNEEGGFGRICTDMRT